MFAHLKTLPWLIMATINQSFPIRDDSSRESRLTSITSPLLGGKGFLFLRRNGPDVVGRVERFEQVELEPNTNDTELFRCSSRAARKSQLVSDRRKNLTHPLTSRATLLPPPATRKPVPSPVVWQRFVIAVARSKNELSVFRICHLSLSSPLSG